MTGRQNRLGLLLFASASNVHAANNADCLDRLSKCFSCVDATESLLSLGRETPIWLTRFSLKEVWAMMDVFGVKKVQYGTENQPGSLGSMDGVFGFHAILMLRTATVVA